MSQAQNQKDRIIEIAESWISKKATDLERRASRIKYLALAWSLTKESKYRKNAIDFFHDEYRKSTFKLWRNEFFSPNVHLHRLMADLAISYKLLEYPAELEYVLDSLLKRRKGKPHSWRNNWYVRELASMAILSKLLHKDRDLAKYKKKIEKTISKLIDSDGTFAEGPSYFLYMLQILNPYFDITGEKNPHVEKAKKWASHLLMPNGKLPPIDDSYYCSPDFYCDEADKYLWGEPIETSHTDSGVYHSPNQTVFRNGDFYLLALHENFKSGYPNIHEHFDLCSFITWKNGKEWHLDTGYPGFKKKWFKTEEPKGHNIVMRGGRPHKALWRFRCFLLRWGSEGKLVDDRTLEMTAKYAGMKVKRRIEIARDKIIVRDITNKEGTILWHLLGDMKINGTEVTWIQGDTICSITVEGASSLSKGKGYHSFGYEQIDAHEVLKILGTHVVTTFAWSQITKE